MLKLNPLKIGLTLALVFGVSIASAETISLKSLIDEAVKNNPDIKAVKQKWEAAKTVAPQMKSLEDPFLSVMFDNVPNSSLNPADSMAREYSVTQAFPYPGKRSLSGKMAEKEAQMIFEESRAKERDIIREVKAAYFDYFIIHKSIEVNLETKEILHHLAKIAEARYSTGLVSQWDVLKAQIELSQLANEIILLNQEKESVKARINRLLNRPMDATLGDPAQINGQRETPPLQGLEEATEERPELKAMTRAVEKEETGLEISRKGYYPDFMVRLAQREEDGSAAGWIAEVGVTIPLWYKTKQDYTVKQSVSQLEAARSEYQGMKNMVLFEIRDSIIKIRSAKSLVDLHQNTHLPQAEQALKGARIAYETGKVDFFALMESWKTVKGYKLDYYKALAAFEQGWADLERAVGKDLQ